MTDPMVLFSMRGRGSCQVVEGSQYWGRLLGGPRGWKAGSPTAPQRLMLSTGDPLDQWGTHPIPGMTNHVFPGEQPATLL